MKQLLFTTNKAITIFNIVSFAIGCALVATCIISLIYGIVNNIL